MAAARHPSAARTPSPSIPLPQAGEGSEATDAALPSPASGRGVGERAAPQARKAKRVALGRAKALRGEQTDAEQRLWHQLRAGRFLGLKFKRQHPVGPYIIDFVCLSRGLAVEADGGQHNGSERDRVRDAFLAANGLRVLRFWNDDILKSTESVLEAIRLAAGEAPSPPTPLPQAVEGSRS